ncbi:MAG: GGDEF domain-containing protein [Pseudomonadales bacterium]
MSTDASNASLQVKFARTDRVLWLLVLNIATSAFLIHHLVTQYPLNLPTNGLTVLFETASFVSVFLMFVGATLVKVTLAARSTLLMALFTLQLGNLLDAANLFFPSASDLYWAIGDALTFSGEILLAFVVFQFVRLTNELANLDPLTRLYNRSYHMRRLSEFLKQSAASGDPVTVIAIDLDHFKHINDVYGHGFGDQVLIQLADTIAEFHSETDLISRTGGEEFEIVARRLDEPAAVRLAEAIRTKISTLNFEQGAKVSASLGVAVSHANEALSSLRQRADAAAYQAKQTGRNRVQLAP